MRLLNKRHLPRFLPHALSLAFLLLWTMGAFMIWSNWRTISEHQQLKLRNEAEVALHGKAAEIEGILQRTYHTIRTISLLPGVRSITPYNRRSEQEDVVKAQRMSQADYDTVQQLYNHIASSVAVSEIYLVFDGFAPQRGEIPFVMFDQVIVDRFHALTGGKQQANADSPEQLESEEYLEYVRQLDILRARDATLPDGGLDAIHPVLSGQLRTCDNSQYTSIKHGDVHNAAGFTVSVPVYAMGNRRLIGLVTAILRSNVFEAALIGLPFVSTNEAERSQLAADKKYAASGLPANYLLENKESGLRIFDRRNPYWTRDASVREATAFHAKVEVHLAGTGTWTLHHYVAQTALDKVLALPLRDAILQLAALSIALGLLGFVIAKMMRLQQLSKEKLEQLAHIDALTGLPNRRLLHIRLHHAVITCARRGRCNALIFIDLDNFKTLNDTQGHDIGDLLLQEVARRLSAAVRESDTVARLGGDEFVILLENMDTTQEDAEHDLEAVAAKLLVQLNHPYQLHDFTYSSTPSIGAVLFCDQSFNADELMKQADLAMYQAKADGRNTMRFYDPDMQARVNARVALESDMSAGLSKNEFILYYQPQVDANGAASGAEVLIRWLHPERGLVPPAEFIPISEESGLIVPLGHMILETACYQLAAWSAQPAMAQLTLAVNISARQFRHAHFVDLVLATIQRTGANPERLKLELTEGIMLHNVEDIIIKMRALRACGIQFSLDDFGTGYSSLSYLKQLPLNQLKVDQSFVRDLDADADDAIIVCAIITMGVSLGLHVIAEGVETNAQRSFLYEHGCFAYQGYLFGKPMPLADFEQFMLRNNEMDLMPLCSNQT